MRVTFFLLQKRQAAIPGPSPVALLGVRAVLPRHKKEDYTKSQGPLVVSLAYIRLSYIGPWQRYKIHTGGQRHGSQGRIYSRSFAASQIRLWLKGLGVWNLSTLRQAAAGHPWKQL